MTIQILLLPLDDMQGKSMAVLTLGARE